MVKLFEDCNLCAIHAKRVTISARTNGYCSTRFALTSEGVLRSEGLTCFLRLRRSPLFCSAQGPTAGQAHPRAGLRSSGILSAQVVRTVSQCAVLLGIVFIASPRLNDQRTADGPLRLRWESRPGICTAGAES